MARKKTAEKWWPAMEAFLAGALAGKAGEHLVDGAGLLVHVDDKTFLYRREKGKNHFTEFAEGANAGIEAQLWLSSNTLQHLLELAALPGTGISTMGVAVCERIFHPEESKKIRIRLETSFLGLWERGYFSVLKAGGPEVASYFVKIGVGGFSRLKDLLRKF